jgi:hypothetical protein
MVWMPLLILPSALWYRRNATFAGAYLAVWLVLAFVALRVPWMSLGAYATLAGGLYELTPLKRHFLDRCRASHGLRHGLDCAGSSAGLMVAPPALRRCELAGLCVTGVDGSLRLDQFDVAVSAD